MTASKSSIDVAVAVLINDRDEVLISFRHMSLHQGGLWEFPGGKIEAGETVPEALRRELLEELGLHLLASTPMTIIEHSYPDKSVRLHVWRVTEWQGEPQGLEGQAITWKPVAELDLTEFPAADAPIVKNLKLPALIAATPNVATLSELEQVIQHLLQQGLTCIQLRQSQLSPRLYLDWFMFANRLCAERQVTLMFNGDLAEFKNSGASGYHANSTRLLSLHERPVPDSTLFSASCHNLSELHRAAALKADFVSLSPVGKTDKYPAGAELGWGAFADLVQQTSLPVYALGGLTRGDLQKAMLHGARGISGIGLFLEDT